jgi:hypothetical protein
MNIDTEEIYLNYDLIVDSIESFYKKKFLDEGFKHQYITQYERNKLSQLITIEEIS